MKYLFSPAVWLLMILSLPGKAQEVVRNEEGKQIVIFPDGSWKYFNEKDSSNLLLLPDSSQSASENQTQLSGHMQLERAKNLEKRLALELIRARLTRMQIEQEINNRKDDADTSPLQTKILAEARLQNAVFTHDKLQAAYDQAKRRSEFLEQIVHYPEDVYKRKLAEWDRQFAGKPDDDAGKKNAGSSALEKIYLSYEPAADVMLHPPVPPCEIVYEGPDPSGIQRRDLQAQTIFSRTDPALRSVFTHNDFIVGKGYLTRMSGGIRVFSLEIVVFTQQAPKLFGLFKKGDLIEFQLLDGTVVRAFNKLNDPGQWNPEIGAFVYKAQYAIGIKEEKLLRSKELDLVRIRWSKVQEEYPVYELDFFRRQFDCLDAEVMN